MEAIQADLASGTDAESFYTEFIINTAALFARNRVRCLALTPKNRRHRVVL